jgi:hypothetical protein
MVLPLWMETYPWHGGTWMAYQDTAQKMRASSYTVIGNERVREWFTVEMTHELVW